MSVCSSFGKTATIHFSTFTGERFTAFLFIRFFFSAARRLVLSIHRFTWKTTGERFTHSLQFHANTFTPLTRIVATKALGRESTPFQSEGQPNTESQPQSPRPAKFGIVCEIATNFSSKRQTGHFSSQKAYRCCKHCSFKTNESQPTSKQLKSLRYTCIIIFSKS